MSRSYKRTPGDSDYTWGKDWWSRRPNSGMPWPNRQRMAWWWKRNTNKRERQANLTELRKADKVEP